MGSRSEDVVGLIRSFVRLAEGTTADFGARGRRDSISTGYKLGIAVRWTASRSVWDGCVEAGFNAGKRVGWRGWLNKGLGSVLALLPIPKSDLIIFQ